VLGDIRALVSGVNVMARRIEELMERHGVEGPRRYYRRLPALHRDPHARRAPAVARRHLPRRFVIDSDGIEPDKTYDVVVEITLPRRRSIHLDFTGLLHRPRVAINASLSQALSGVLFAVRCFVDHTNPDERRMLHSARHQLPPRHTGQPQPTGRVWRTASSR
jgi:N-methylhydantoinase B